MTCPIVASLVIFSVATGTSHNCYCKNGNNSRCWQSEEGKNVVGRPEAIPVITAQTS